MSLRPVPIRASFELQHIVLKPDRLTLGADVKFERCEFTGWRPIRPLELGFSVTNLLNKEHSEGPFDGIVIYKPRVFRRIGSVNVTWRF